MVEGKNLSDRIFDILSGRAEGKLAKVLAHNWVSLTKRNDRANRMEARTTTFGEHRGYKARDYDPVYTKLREVWNYYEENGVKEAHHVDAKSILTHWKLDIRMRRMTQQTYNALNNASTHHIIAFLDATSQDMPRALEVGKGTHVATFHLRKTVKEGVVIQELLAHIEKDENI